MDDSYDHLFSGLAYNRREFERWYYSRTEHKWLSPKEVFNQNDTKKIRIRFSWKCIPSSFLVNVLFQKTFSLRFRIKSKVLIYMLKVKKKKNIYSYIIF